MLPGRRILLGVTGGIAAYKAVMLARRLVEAGADVKVMMTRSAGEFVGARSFAAVTKHPVAEDLFAAGAVSPHTELAEWADLIVIAPATTVAPRSPCRRDKRRRGHRHADGRPVARRAGPGDAHRDVGAPRHQAGGGST